MPEARVDRLHLLNAAQDEAGPDEQRRRDRELCDDQGVAPPKLLGLPAPSVRSMPEMSGRELSSAATSPNGAGHDRDVERDREDAAVETEIERHRKLAAGRSPVANRPSSQTESSPAQAASSRSSVASVSSSRHTSDPRETPTAKRTATSLRLPMQPVMQRAPRARSARMPASSSASNEPALLAAQGVVAPNGCGRGAPQQAGRGRRRVRHSASRRRPSVVLRRHWRAMIASPDG